MDVVTSTAKNSRNNDTLYLSYDYVSLVPHFRGVGAAKHILIIDP